MMSAKWGLHVRAQSGKFRRSTLLMNALYLMFSTLAVAVSGFVFWVIVARIHSAATVGLATTLLSVSGLLSLLGLAGFDTTFVRFLPRSERKNDYMNTGLVLVTLVSAALAIIMAAVLPIVAPRLSVLRELWPFVGFVFFTVATTLNVLTNAIFLAFKRARMILIINVLFSAVRIALPLVVRRGGVMTIFVLVGVSQLAGLVLSLAVIRARLGFAFSPKVHLDILRVIKKYSFSVYASSILNLLPPTLLPLLVVHMLAPENAAYYYMAFTIASVLYTISYASMQSAFAEGSHNEPEMRAHVAKAAKLVGALLVPAVLITVVLSGFILRIFGGAYAANGATLLRLFALSAVPVAMYSAMGAYFKVTKNLRGVVLMNIVYAAVILGVSYAFLRRDGVVAIGWAWMLGNVAAVVTGLFFLKQRNYATT